MGYKSGGELEDIIKNASYIVVPSEWYENNPLTILEAYSLGKPVIGADIGGIPEILLDGETGFLFNSGDSQNLKEVIAKALSLSNQEYGKLSHKARNFSQKKFDPLKHYTNLLKIYLNVIDEHKIE